MFKQPSTFLVAAIGAVVPAIWTAPAASACTGIRLKPRDGSIIYARTLEFGVDLHSNIIIIPRGKSYTGTGPGGPGLQWTTRYGALGASAFGLPLAVDGLNEKGLAVGVFYFPGYARYQQIGAAEAAQALAPHELATYLLTTCADVPEAVAAARRVKVGEVVLKELGFATPVHFIAHDPAGRCCVLEYVEGRLMVHDNPLGVMSNSPAFDWHITNLRNYVNLTVTNVPQVALSGLKLPAFGQGSGLLGLPGDFTPPSRFIRAVAFSQSAVRVDTAREGVLQAFHILNQFDIPRGAAREHTEGGNTVDYTLWTSVADLKNLRYYFHTYESRRIRMIDLKHADLTAKEIKVIPMAGAEEIEDVTTTGK